MSRKDFEAIARILLKNRPEDKSKMGLWFNIKEDIVNYLADTNERFDPDKFNAVVHGEKLMK